MTFGERAKALRRELGLSQEAIGAQGFMSTPGWIKIENAQRQPSEKLIEAFVRFVAQQKNLSARAATALRQELLILKHLGDTSPFVRGLVQAHAKATGLGHLLAASTAPKARRGRPASTKAREVAASAR